MIKAEDSGGLSSTATINIKVTDINDKNPEFVDLPYEFKISEGEKGRAVGSVHAIDLDEGQNAQVSYSLPEDIPFSIDEKSGEIKTVQALDYETQKVRRDNQTRGIITFTHSNCPSCHSRNTNS